MSLFVLSATCAISWEEENDDADLLQHQKVEENYWQCQSKETTKDAESAGTKKDADSAGTKKDAESAELWVLRGGKHEK